MDLQSTLDYLRSQNLSLETELEQLRAEVNENRGEEESRQAVIGDLTRAMQEQIE